MEIYLVHYSIYLILFSVIFGLLNSVRNAIEDNSNSYYVKTMKKRWHSIQAVLQSYVIGVASVVLSLYIDKPYIMPVLFLYGLALFWNMFETVLHPLMGISVFYIDENGIGRIFRKINARYRLNVFIVCKLGSILLFGVLSYVLIVYF